MWLCRAEELLSGIPQSHRHDPRRISTNLARRSGVTLRSQGSIDRHAASNNAACFTLTVVLESIIRLTSYFPRDDSAAGSRLTCSSHRSRSSRAAATRCGSFLIFFFGSRFALASVASGFGMENRNPPDAIDDRL